MLKDTVCNFDRMLPKRYAILWILPYAVILSLPELIMDVVATSRNFVNTVYSEASFLYDELDHAPESDATDTSDTDSYTVDDDAKED